MGMINFDGDYTSRARYYTYRSKEGHLFLILSWKSEHRINLFIQVEAFPSINQELLK